MDDGLRPLRHSSGPDNNSARGVSMGKSVHAVLGVVIMGLVVFTDIPIGRPTAGQPIVYFD